MIFETVRSHLNHECKIMPYDVCMKTIQANPELRQRETQLPTLTFIQYVQFEIMKQSKENVLDCGEKTCEATVHFEEKKGVKTKLIIITAALTELHNMSIK